MVTWAMRAGRLNASLSPSVAIAFHAFRCLHKAAIPRGDAATRNFATKMFDLWNPRFRRSSLCSL